MTLAAASIMKPDYVPTNYQTFLLTTLLMAIHSVMASAPTRRIAQINAVGSTFNMIALFVVIILILAATDRTSRDPPLPRYSPSREVWGTIYAGTDYPGGVSVLMSFLGIIWTLSGYDSAFHLSEECSNANVASPRAIVMTSASGGFLGWLLSLVVAYTVVDISAAIASPLGQPFAAYLMQALPKRVALVVLALTITGGFFMGQGSMVAASRVAFAYARDDCLPLSRVLRRVNGRTQTPVNAVLANSAIGVCLTLLILGGPYAAGAMFSIGGIAQFVAFTIPVFIRLFFVGDRFRPGPWSLGRASFPIGVVGCAFVLLMVPIMCLVCFIIYDGCTAQ